MNNSSNEYILKNSFLTLVVKKKGAELCSLKTDQREYMWQAKSQFWGRHAPILFPIVGRLIDHKYTYKDKNYTMKQHGFARDSDFELIDKTVNSAVFQLTNTAKSLELFPYEFKLQVKYILVNKSLKVEYIVKNPSENEDLYFSIGAHPAFNCPFETGHFRNEYELIFDQQLAPESQNILDGLRINKTTKVFDQKGKLTLHKNIFDDDALIFNPNPFSKVTFVHKPTQKKYLSVLFKNYPYLGIWSSSENSPFVCIEPWHGITDHKDHNNEISQKEGIIRLLPHKIFDCEYTIQVL